MKKQKIKKIVTIFLYGAMFSLIGTSFFAALGMFVASNANFKHNSSSTASVSSHKKSSAIEKSSTTSSTTGQPPSDTANNKQNAANPPAAKESAGSTNQDNSEQPAKMTEIPAQPPPVQIAQPVAPPPPLQTMHPNTICVHGKAIPFKDSGTGSAQNAIDSNPYGIAATYGGAPTYSGKDDANTHFIGHREGVFYVLLSSKVGDKITVTDSGGRPTNYQIVEVVIVNREGFDSHGNDHWEKILGISGGERITLQTCTGNGETLIIFANPIN